MAGSVEDVESRCIACRANRGEIATPGGVIYQDGLWRLEHAFEPIPMVGWLILKPLRHVEALAQLASTEAELLGPLVQRISSAMMEVLQPAKIYVACFAESVAHLHFHLIPRSAEILPEDRGPDIFRYLGQAAREGRNLADLAAAERTARAVRERLT